MEDARDVHVGISQARFDDPLGRHPDVITEIVCTDPRGHIVWRQEAAPKVMKRQRWGDDGGVSQRGGRDDGLTFDVERVRV